MAGRDDDALSWEGDDDPTLDTGTASPAGDDPTPVREETGATERSVPRTPEDTPAITKPPVGSPPPRRPAPAASAPATAPVPATASAPAPMDNVTLVSLGVLGGIYLLLAIGWFIGGSRLQVIAQLFLEPVGYLVTWLVAVLAPAIVFVTVLVTTRGRRTWLRMVLLVAGALALLPWPFLMVGVGIR